MSTNTVPELAPMLNIIINGVSMQIEPGHTVIQACEMVGVEIPRFCYHEKLQIAGNCRMCLVSIKGIPKPVASCAQPVTDKMEIVTDSPQVKEMRENVMRFLLANHPLDCPVCDQGGECDLQDQAMLYGMDHSDFAGNKRAVSYKYFGPLVETNMTRCIHCTRCVRFMEEVAGTNELGMVGRGEDAEIVSVFDTGLRSELSGNIIDLCPVGALTNKPAAFKIRSWELAHHDAIDVTDALGSSIQVDCRDNKVMRILPRLNEDVNEIWISDKARFAHDGLYLQRIDRPYVRKNGLLKESTWQEALGAIANKLTRLNGKRIGAIAGDMADCESMLALKDLMRALGSGNTDCRQDSALIPFSDRCHYLFNSGVTGIDQADFFLLIGVNPRLDAPVLNSRILKRYNRGGAMVVSIGVTDDLTYPTQDLGSDPTVLVDIMRLNHPICDQLQKAKFPMLIIGQDIFCRDDRDGIICHLSQIADQFGFVTESWNGFNVLHRAASRVGGLDIGFVPELGGLDIEQMLDDSGKLGLLYLLGADEFDMSRVSAEFVVYQGHHGDNGAHRADVVLPGSAYLEKDCMYVNTEGRLQRCRQVISPPGEAMADYRIILELADIMGLALGYINLSSLRERFSAIWPAGEGLISRAQWKPFAGVAHISSEPISLKKFNYYMTDSISRTSPTMMACTHDATKRRMLG